LVEDIGRIAGRIVGRVAGRIAGRIAGRVAGRITGNEISLGSIVCVGLQLSISLYELVEDFGRIAAYNILIR
jgi:outer membrane lipoprotein SlyB